MLRKYLLPCLFLLPSIGQSHEFWIEPFAWQIAPDEVLQAHIRVGENMKGAALSYFPKNTKRFEVVTPQGQYKVGGSIGDRPVLRGTARDTGLYVIIYVTGSDILTYSEEEKFIDFVEHKDLDDTLEVHAERGLPKVGFDEKFSRYAKSLVSVGDGKGQDRVFGLLTEITALANPYTADLSEGLPVQLTYRGQPRTDAQIEIYERDAEQQVSVRTVRTDETGKAVIDVKPGHDYMLDAVVMRPIEPEKEGDAVWESLWANLTFQVPQE